jgi:hypothetical protein
MGHTPESAAACVAELRAQRQAAGRLDEPFEVTVGGECTGAHDVAAWEAAGVDRLIVSPWRRTAEVLDGMAGFAARLFNAGP